MKSVRLQRAMRYMFAMLTLFAFASVSKAQQANVPGYTSFVAIDTPGVEYIWAYNSSDGTVSLGMVNYDGTLFGQVYKQKWDTGFSSFVVGNDLTLSILAYRASDGTIAFHTLNALFNNGVGFTQQSISQWDRGFTGFTRAGNYVWAYKSSDGTVSILNSGTLSQTFLYKWDKGFSGFAPAGSSYIWAYRASDGTVCIHQIKNNGNGFNQKYTYKWDTGFSSFAGVEMGGEAYVWAYKASDGTVCIHKISPSGSGFTQTFYDKWDTGFSSFVGYSLGGNAFIFAYRASDGRICILKIKSQGKGFTQKYMF